VAGGRLRRGGKEAAVLEQPRDPGGHGGLVGSCFVYLGGRRGGEWGREREIWVASWTPGLYSGVSKVQHPVFKFVWVCRPGPQTLKITKYIHNHNYCAI